MAHKFRSALSALLGLTLLCAGYSVASADEITMTLDTPVSGAPGDTITVYGDLTNTTASTLYFGSDTVNLTVPPSVATGAEDLITNGSLGLGPTSLAAGQTLTAVDLFSVTLAGGSGSYLGNSFVLFGGTDPAACTGAACAQLGSVDFSINVAAPVPLPASGWLLLAALGIGALSLQRTRAGDQRPVSVL